MKLNLNKWIIGYSAIVLIFFIFSSVMASINGDFYTDDARSFLVIVYFWLLFSLSFVSLALSFFYQLLIPRIMWWIFSLPFILTVGFFIFSYWLSAILALLIILGLLIVFWRKISLFKRIVAIILILAGLTVFGFNGFENMIELYGYSRASVSDPAKISWRTFESQNGFRIKYPRDYWCIYDIKGKTNFEISYSQKHYEDCNGGTVQEIYIDVYKNIASMPKYQKESMLIDYLENRKKEFQNNYPGQDYKINNYKTEQGLDGFSVEYKYPFGSKKYEVYLEKNNKIYRLDNWTDQKMFDYIINSMEITK